MIKKYKIYAPVDWIYGHLRYGHFEGEVELTDKEFQEIKKNPNLIKEYGVNLIIDDYEISNYGDIEKIEFEEID